MLRGQNTWVLIDWGAGGPEDFQNGQPTQAQDRLAAVLDWARRLVPVERIVVTVLEQEAPWWHKLLEAIPVENIVQQPVDRGSAAAVLMGALQIRHLSPQAEMILLGRVSGRIGVEELINLYHSEEPELLSMSLAHLHAKTPNHPGALDSFYPFLSCTDFGSEFIAARNMPLTQIAGGKAVS